MTAIQIFERLTDNRKKCLCKYELSAILLVYCIALLCGVKTYRHIELFANIYLRLFNKKYNLGWKKAPSYSTFCNALIAINDTEFEILFREFMSFYNSGILNKILACDGKVLAATKRGTETNPVHYVSVFDTENKLVLGHKFTESYEVETAKELIKELNVENQTITLDAVHNHDSTIDTVTQQKADIVVQVKDNKKKNKSDCIKAFEAIANIEKYERNEKGHGRIEKRVVEVVDHDASILKSLSESIKTVIRVTRTAIKTNKKDSTPKTGIRYYISTKKISAKDAYKIIRLHWHIENCNHYVRDHNFNEDFCNYSKTAKVQVIFRSLVLNILRINKRIDIPMALLENLFCVKKMLKTKEIA